MQKRKKGNIILLGAALIIIFLMVFGIYLNVATSYETYNRIQTAVEEGAKVRAQAIDIYLKESAGIIEAYHENTEYADDINHSEILKAAGHLTPLHPDNTMYQEARENADQDAYNAIMSMLDISLIGTTSGHETLLYLDRSRPESHLCVQVKALPRTKADATHMDFSCTTGNGEVVSAKNIKITPVEGTKGVYNEGKNRQMIFDPTPEEENSGDELIHEVVNVVFVGASFEHRHFIANLFNVLNRYFPADAQAPITAKKKAWAIAYPQIDQCFGEFCTPDPEELFANE